MVKVENIVESEGNKTEDEEYGRPGGLYWYPERNTGERRFCFRKGHGNCTIKIGYVSRKEKAKISVSFVNPVAQDDPKMKDTIIQEPTISQSTGVTHRNVMPPFCDNIMSCAKKTYLYCHLKKETFRKKYLSCTKAKLNQAINNLETE